MSVVIRKGILKVTLLASRQVTGLANNQELIELLALDQTGSGPYISGEYVCFDFAAELNNNAEANGIRAAYVHIRFETWGHAIVAFEMVARGAYLY